MSDAAQFWASIKGHFDDLVGRLRPIRVQAVSQAAGLLTVQRYENTTPDGEQYARLVGFVTNAGDEVICLNLDGTLLPLGTIQRASPASYTLDAPLFLQNQATNSGIELGKPLTVETPYVDFHSSGNNTDYDGRIIASGGTGSNGQGTLSYQAATHTFNGALTATGTLSFPANALTSLNIDTGYFLLYAATGQNSLTASTTSSSRQSTLSVAITLPTGTWNILLVGGGRGFNSTGAIQLSLTNNTTVATAQAGSFPYSWTGLSSYAALMAIGTFAGHSGSQTYFTSYNTNGTGTAFFDNPYLWIFGKRTS